MLIKYIYTFFIGILLATFIGVGIAAFYEAPKYPEFPASSVGSLRKPMMPPVASQSAQEQEREWKLSMQYEEKMKAYQAANRLYNRNVSLFTTAAAVLILIISLTMLKKLDMLSDGLLLGGLFTQLYSITRGFESQDNKFRFLVVSVGLAASLIVGYMKFIRNKNQNTI